jgi:alpha-tubulin suppressor-like RCC1 family protein
MKKTSRAIVNGLQIGILLVGLCAPAVGHAGLVAAWGGVSSAERLVPANGVNIRSISAGSSFSLALRADGHVVAWGDKGATNVPTGLTDVTAIAAGRWHGLAVKADGTVVAWGDQNSIYGQTNVPPGLSDVVAVAAADMFSLALKADGTVVSWGVTTNVPAEVSDVVAIATGSKHALALKADGTVFAWGSNGDGQANVPVGLSNVTAVAGGDYHSVALKFDGTVVAWGTDLLGQTNVPVGLSNVTAVACGGSHCLARRSDGTVVAWGSNSYTQTNVPSVLRNVTAISAGADHSLALLHDGPPQIVVNPQSLGVPYTSNVVFTVKATGWQPLGYQWFHDGQALTGTGRILGATDATLIITNTRFSDIGTYTVVVSNVLGSVISTGAMLTVISPPFIMEKSPDQIVRAGTNLTFSVAADGTPALNYQWFFNETSLAGTTSSSFTLTNVQPGNSGVYSLLVTNTYGSAQADVFLTVTDSPPYILLQPNQDDFQKTVSNIVVGVGGSTTIRVSAHGSLPLNYQWRFNGADLPGATNSSLTLNQLNYEQTGFYNVVVSNPFGDVISAKVFLSVVQVFVWGDYHVVIPNNTPLNLTNVTAVAAGASHVLALKPDGRVTTWVIPLYGLNPYNLTNVPASVTNVVAIAAAGNSSMALRANGSVVVWGDNSSGITNIPVSVSNVMAIATSGNHCLVLRSNGTVLGWGNNSYGQINVPAGLSNVVGIAAGNSHSLALKADGKVVAWGNNSSGQTNIPAVLSNVIAIATSGHSCLALHSNGTVTAWGNQYGNVPPPWDCQVPLGLSNVVAMTAGEISLALRADGSITNWGCHKLRVQPTLTNVIAVASQGVVAPANFHVALIGNGSPVMTIQPATQTTTRGATVPLHARAVGVQPMSYQWQLNGVNLPAATNATLVLTNVQGKDTGSYRMIAANALGNVVSATARVTMPFSTNLPAALNATNLVWTTSPTNAAWFAQVRETHDGDVAAQSGPITHGQSSFLQTTVDGPGTLTFWWKISSEEGFDFLKFFLDNSATPLASISGDTAWKQMTIHLAAGKHSLKWVYAKDGSVSDGQDAGWVDEVVFTPDPPVITQQPTPPSVTAGMGDNVTFHVTASSGTASGGRLRYQWLKDGVALIIGTDSHLILTNVTRRDGATYAVRVSNAGGSTISSNATLVVRVPQRLQTPIKLADDSYLILSGDADGGALLPEDLPAFKAQTSTDLVNWVTLPITPVLSNGFLILHDPDSTNVPTRFYRVLEH